MTGKDGAKKEIEITDPGNPVFSAQVFAEMLGMANKPEYFQHEPEQEVLDLPSPHLLFKN